MHHKLYIGHFNRLVFRPHDPDDAVYAGATDVQAQLLSSARTAWPGVDAVDLDEDDEEAGRYEGVLFIDDEDFDRAASGMIKWSGTTAGGAPFTFWDPVTIDFKQTERGSA